MAAVRYFSWCEVTGISACRSWRWSVDDTVVRFSRGSGARFIFDYRAGRVVTMRFLDNMINSSKHLMAFWFLHTRIKSFGRLVLHSAHERLPKTPAILFDGFQSWVLWLEIPMLRRPSELVLVSSYSIESLRAEMEIQQYLSGENIDGTTRGHDEV